MCPGSCRIILGLKVSKKLLTDTSLRVPDRCLPVPLYADTLQFVTASEAVDEHRLADALAYREARVERRIGVLKDDLYLAL